MLAAEVISLELLKAPTEAATYQLVHQIALVDDANKRRVAAAAIMTESKRLEEAYAVRALRSMDHARNLAMMQVEAEALEAAAIIHRLTGATVDLGVLRGIIADNELDAVRAQGMGGAIATRWRNAQLAELSVNKLKGEAPGAIVRRFSAAKDQALKIVDGHAGTLAFEAYNAQHRTAWRALSTTADRPVAFRRPVEPIPYPLPPLDSDPFGTGSEDGLPYGWGEGMFHVWSAILDRKTCSVCFGLDGSMIPVGKPWPHGMTMPAHPRCRCVETTIFIPEALSRKLPGIQIDYAALKDDVREFMRGSGLSIGTGKRHAQNYIAEALGKTSPRKLTEKLSDRRAYFVAPPRPRAPKLAGH